jgi:universal stress protein A
MPAYHRILAAIDLTDDSHAVAERAAEIAHSGGGSLHLLHVVELMPVEPMGDTMAPTLQIDDQLIVRSRTQIAALAASLGLPKDAASVEVGTAKGEILRCARKGNFDLIVLGSRERHGLSILVNHTEDTVLHGAPCDVLAVRVR